MTGALLAVAVCAAALGLVSGRERRLTVSRLALAPRTSTTQHDRGSRRFADRLRARHRSRLQALERRRAVPLLAELLRMGVSAGLPPAGALRHASRWIPGAAGAELAGVVADLDAGLSLRETLDGLRRRAPELRGVARILQSSAELGTEIGPALARLARDEREALRRAAEARARTVPVRLLFPLVFLVLPAFVLLGVVPTLLAGSPP